MCIPKIIIVLLLVTSFILAQPVIKNNVECKELVREYNLDIKLKTYNGWKRVCNNDKLYLYTSIKPNAIDTFTICNCFIESEIDRNIESFKTKE